MYFVLARLDKELIQNPTYFPQSHSIEMREGLTSENRPEFSASNSDGVFQSKLSKKLKSIENCYLY
jgi:hypothetical protein